METDDNERFLLIEDDEIDQFISSTILNKHYPELQCVKLKDGQKAIEYLERSLQNLNFNKIKFILLDIMMPRMSGHEFLEEYASRFFPHFKHIPVFMISTSINIKDKNQCYAYPFVKDYIQKPLSNKILYQRNLLKDY
jgi:CheY-like chemotaxis protein